MKHSIAIIFIVFTFALQGMEIDYNVVVTTSDQQKFTLPRWKIRESNTLYTAFLKKLKETTDIKETPDPDITLITPVCITTPTLSYNELHAYSNALEQKDFDNYYKKELTPEQQRMLTIAVGQHSRNDNDELIPKLWDTAMSMKILNSMLDEAMAKEQIINPCFTFESKLNVITCVADHFRRICCINNAKEKKYTQATRDYSHKIRYCQNDSGFIASYALPEFLELPYGKVSSAPLFSGTTNTLTPWTQSDGSQWEVLYRLDLIDSSYYIVTQSEPIGTDSPENRVNVWINIPGKKEILLKQISHNYDIDNIIVNQKGTVLAISSKYKDEGELSLLSLDMENDVLKNDKELIIPGCYDSLTFTKNSNHVVTTRFNKLTLWDINTGIPAIELICPGKKIELVSFNSDDSRLAVATYDYEDISGITINERYFVTLYDTTHLEQPIILSTIDLSDPDSDILIAPHSLTFLSLDNKLLIGTTNHALVLDEYSGDIIMKTDKVSITDNTDDTDDAEFNTVRPTLMPKLNLLATVTSNFTNTCNLQLWDIDSKSLITTLLENKSQMFGVGTIPGCLSLVATFVPDHVFTITSLSDTDDVAAIKNNVDTSLQQLNLFQLYCLHRIDKENYKQIRPRVNIHRQSLLYKGIKSLPQNVKDVMYNIFHILHAYGSTQ